MNDQPKPPGASGEGTQPATIQPPLQSSVANATERIQGSVATATARIQVIIEAAEKAAAGIIDDAEAQARNYLEESRYRADRIADQRAKEMSTLADALVERAEAVKQQSDGLLRALDQAKVEVEGRLGAEPGPGRKAKPPIAEAAEEAEEPPAGGAPIHHLKPVQHSPFVAGTPSDGARLLATQMAVAGSTRPEIEGRLQNEFGIHDAGPMLDAILGRED